MKLSPARIVGIYSFTCILWITLSDKLLFLFRDVLSPSQLEIMSGGKGLFFILVTGLLLYKAMVQYNKRLCESEQKYRQMYDNSPLPKWIYDLDTLRFASVNEAAIKSYGYAKEEFLSKTILDIRPVKDLTRVLEATKTIAINTKQTGTWTHIKASGEHIFVNISSQIITINQKTHVMVTAHDITEKVVFEQRLEHLNQKLINEKQKLIDIQRAARIGRWVFYLDDQYLSWSEEMYIILDIKSDPGLNLYDLYIEHVYPDDRPKMIEGLDNLIKYAQQLDVIHRVVLPNGTLLYVRQLARLECKNGMPYKVIGSMQDITELMLLEQERNRYLYSFEDTLNSISETFYSLNRDMVITKLNKSFEFDMGLSSTAMLGKKLIDVLPDIADTCIINEFQKVLIERITVRFETFLPTLNKWIFIAAYPTEEGIAVYYNDITDRKEKDIQLKKAVERYETVAKATHDVIYDLDIVNNHLAFYTDLSQLITINKEDVQYTVEWWRSLVHPDDVAGLVESQLAIIEKKESNWKYEYRIRYGQNQYKYVFSQGYYIYNNNGEPVRLIGAVKDIDALKQSNDENRRLANIITKVNNMIVLMDTNHAITWVNKAFEDYCGYRLERIKGLWPENILGGDLIPANIITEVLERKNRLETFTIDMKHYLYNGKSQWVNIEYTPLFDEGKHAGYIAVHKNITIRKEREEKIYKQNKVLQDISWSSSHEMRKPVASILGLAFLAKDADNIREKDEIIEMINTCAQELDTIVRNITDKISDELYHGPDRIITEPLK